MCRSEPPAGYSFISLPAAGEARATAVSAVDGERLKPDSPDIQGPRVSTVYRVSADGGFKFACRPSVEITTRYPRVKWKADH